MGPPATALRSDARANRERILSVAREALDLDPGTSLNAIAKAASVGAGTLYRHFPTREALIVAVNASEVARLVETAFRLTEEMPPLAAFREWCLHLIGHVRRQRGFAAVLRAALSEQETREAYRPIAAALAHLVAAAEAAGVIAPGHDAEDIQLLLSFTWQIQTELGECRARRVVDLILAGLAA